jgi:hypothetical protein
MSDMNTQQSSSPEPSRPWWRRGLAGLLLLVFGFAAAGTVGTPPETGPGVFYRIVLMLTAAAAAVTFVFTACKGGCAMPRPTG